MEKILETEVVTGSHIVDVDANPGDVIVVHVDGVKTEETPTPTEGSLAEQLVAKATRNRGPSFEVFCVAWNAAANLTEFCTVTGMLPQAASQRATGYRKAGVELKEFPKGSKGGKRLNVANMNAILAKAKETTVEKPVDVDTPAATEGEVVPPSDEPAAS